MRIYISGPISGRDAGTVREEFEAAEKMILERGHVPVNPVKIAEKLPQNSEWKDHMAADLPELFSCDAIYQLAGWKRSHGCQLENMAAIYAHMPRYCALVPVPFASPKLAGIYRREQEDGRKRRK